MEVEEGHDAPTDEAGIGPQNVAAIEAKGKELSKGRKKRSVPAASELPSPSAMSECKTFTLHKTSPAGITCLALHAARPDLALTGGADKTVVLFDATRGEQIATLSGHSKKVTSVAFLGGEEAFASSSADGSVRLWRANQDGGEWGGAAVLSGVHKGEVSAINLWANMLACTLLILLSIAGAVLWFKRRSVRRPQLSLPPHSNHASYGWRLLLTLSAVLFPLSGVVLLLIALLDSLLNRRQSS